MDSQEAVVRNSLFWWLVAAVSGAIALVLPRLIPVPLSSLAIFSVQVIWLFMVGFIISMINPVKAWRWGVAAVILFPFIEATLILFQPQTSGSAFPLFQLIPYILIMLPIYALYALPALLGAHLGSSWKSGAFHHDRVKGWLVNMEFWGLAFLLGGIGSGVPLLFTERGPLILTFWFATLTLASALMGFFRPEKVWRWGLAVILSLCLVVIARIIIDVTRYAAPHQFFPLEIWFAVMYGALPAFGGAYLGAWFRRYMHDHHHKGMHHA